MIYLNSRYASVPLTPATDSRTSVVTPTVYRFRPAGAVKAYQSYTWREGDRIDVLAARFYADATQWWRILDDNPHVVDPSNITPGTVLRVSGD